MLSHSAEFPSFQKAAHDSTACIYNIFLIILIFDGHLGYFRILCFKNSATMNIGMVIFFQDYRSVFSSTHFNILKIDSRWRCSDIFFSPLGLYVEAIGKAFKSTLFHFMHQYHQKDYFIDFL
jgi:hypothetical protein